MDANHYKKPIRTTRREMLCGCLIAELTAEEFNEWHDFYGADPDRVRLYAQGCAHEFAARNATDPVEAERLWLVADEKIKEMRAISKQWLARCMERREAEDAEAIRLWDEREAAEKARRADGSYTR